MKKKVIVFSALGCFFENGGWEGIQLEKRPPATLPLLAEKKKKQEGESFSSSSRRVNPLGSSEGGVRKKVGCSGVS